MRTIKAKFNQYIIFEAAPLKSILFSTLFIFLLSLFVNVTIGTSCLGASEPNITWLTQGRGLREDMNKYGKASKNVSCTRSKAKAIAHPVFPLRRPQSDRGNFSEAGPWFFKRWII